MNITPTLKEFKTRCKKGNVVPVSFDYSADLETPVSIFKKLSRGQESCFLLESVELGERLGRYSFIGTHPDAIVECKRGRIHLTHRGQHKILPANSKLLHVLEAVMKAYCYVPDREIPKFPGGFVGYIGYELVQQFEDITLRAKPGVEVPDAVLFFCRNLVAFDHIKHQLKVVHLAHISESPIRAYEKARRALLEVERILQKPLTGKQMEFLPPKKLNKTRQIKLKSNTSRNQFENMVRRAKKLIRAGDVIQVVLSQRFDLGKIKNDFLLYRTLRSLNPSPYMFYYRHEGQTILGSSPELLTRCSSGQAEVRPIAGTRPRGENDEQDITYETQLLNSSKELAEHLMLVDLGRNDLGRVSEPKSVEVKNFARVERYSHVMHLVSDVVSKLKRGRNSFDLLRATFPAGTVSGAPKIRAMQIIDELEPDRRGPYAGALGFFSLTGDLEMCITIRTIVIDRGHAYVQAGAGIVNDSDPKREFQETVNKARALLDAVELARRNHKGK